MREKGNGISITLGQKDNIYGGYSSWYTEAYEVIKHLLPDRLSEFAGYYQPDSRRKEVNGSNYTIQDWILGNRSPVYSPISVGGRAGKKCLMIKVRLQRDCLHRLQ